MEIKRFQQFLNEGLNPEQISDSKIIDLAKLKAYANAIRIICNGEYGQVYYNPSEEHIFVSLGDSNPFDIDSLEYYLQEAVATNYNASKAIKVTIGNETTPHIDEHGWYIYYKDRFIPYFSLEELKKILNG